MFVNREDEFTFLNAVLERTRPTPAQLVLLYGRRRIGKTVLARRWADLSGLPTIYWAAEREPAALQRRKLFAQMLGVQPLQAATFGVWADLWNAFASMVGDRRQILILDEVPYAVESDSAFLTSLQHAWDQHFKGSQLVMLLSGSHVHTIETFLDRGSPLFGRFTGQWHLQPLPFGALRAFLPRWSAAERVAAYAIVGGVPAYLEWLDPKASLAANLRHVILAPGSPFVAEPALLLYDEVREPRVYHAILQAIGAGAHTLDEIANTALVGKTHLSSYLARLQELRYVERRLPITIPSNRRARSRAGRYHLPDPFFRFYFRFIAPQRAEVGYRPEDVLPGIQEGLRGFVESTAFEELARMWVARMSAREALPFGIEEIGSHWSRDVQIDVVAVNWREKAILAGECKWGRGRVSRDVVRDFVEGKTPRLLKGLPDMGRRWSVHHALFGREGFTPAASAWAAERGVILMNLSKLDQDLAES